MDSFPFWPANESSEQVELFAKKIVPKVKEDVKRERNTLVQMVDHHAVVVKVLFGY